MHTRLQYMKSEYAKVKYKLIRHDLYNTFHAFVSIPILFENLLQITIKFIYCSVYCYSRYVEYILTYVIEYKTSACCIWYWSQSAFQHAKD